MHELLHQGGVGHPGDESAPEDIKILKLAPPRIPNSYNSSLFTTREISKNIMLYNFYIVGGKFVKDERKEEDASKATPGQLKQIINNIDKGRVNGEPVNDK